MFHRQIILCLISLLLATFVTAASATEADMTRSQVGIVFRQMSTPIEAPFKHFHANIDYDPMHPEKAKAFVEMDTHSLDLGDADYNKVIQQKEWLDSKQFPTATFLSKAIKVTATNGLLITGTLKIKGHSEDIDIPIRTRVENGFQIFEGTTRIRRLAFHLGEGDWADTSVLEDQVTIKLRFALPR